MNLIIILGITKMTEIKDVEEEYKKLCEQGYPLDYLNVEYNIEEANKKLIDIMDRPTGLFGGKTVILGGDFMQTLPIKKKATNDQIISHV